MTWNTTTYYAIPTATLTCTQCERTTISVPHEALTDMAKQLAKSGWRSPSSADAICPLCSLAIHKELQR